jgi:hypothetical protein
VQLATSTIGRKLTVIAGAGITLNGAVSANNSGGDSIIFSGTTFHNNAGGSALNAGSGRFLVWSSDPANDDRGGLAYNFKQYSATYGATTVLGAGDGFLYTLAPVITPSLTGTVSKVYNANTTATFAGSNYSVSGAVDNDTVTLNNPSSGLYDTKNVGTGKNVSVTGIAIASATNGSATVYGYQLGTTTANANIGVITPATLTYTANNTSMTYGDTVPSLSGSVSGFVGGETQGTATTGTLSFGTSASNTSHVGSYAITGSGLTADNGNYTFVQAGPNSTALTITQRSINLTGTRVYDASSTINSGMLSVGNVVNGDNVTLGGSATVSSKNVGTYTSFATNNLTQLNSDYTFSGGTSNVSITPASLIITADPNQSKTYGANDTATGFTYLSSGLFSGDSITGNLGRTTGENVSTYAYTLGSISAGSNYTASLTAGSTFEVTPKSLTITADPSQEKMYGASDTASGFTYSNSGLINGVTPKYWDSAGSYVDAATIDDSATGRLGRAAGEDVGMYAYNLGSFTANSNYNTTLFTSDTFAITAATITITAVAGQSKIFGTADPAAFMYNTTGLMTNVTPRYWNTAGQYVNATVLNDTLSGAMDRNAGEAIGRYSYTLGNISTSAPNNYNLRLTSGSFEIVSGTTSTATINQDSILNMFMQNPTMIFQSTLSPLQITLQVVNTCAGEGGACGSDVIPDFLPK